MYTGTLIDDLIATVERAEEHTNDPAPDHAQEEKLAYWYAVSQAELAQFSSQLAGVA